MPSRRALLGGFGAAAGTALAGCLGGPTARYAGESGDEPDTAWWPLPEFDRIAGCYNPRPVGPREGVTERWRVDISGPSARPVVADGTAYLPTADALVAVDAATGEQQWREDGDDPPLWPRRVAVHDGLVYLAQVGDPGVLALDAATGDRQWSVPTTTSGVRTLLVDSERDDLYLGGGRGTVLGLDARTGERYWSREVFGPVTALAESIPELLVATEAGEVYGLSGDDGRGYWRAQVPGPVESLATANGRGAFVSTFGGPTVELEGTRAGAVGWRRGVWSADSFVVAGRSLVGAGRRPASGAPTRSSSPAGRSSGRAAGWFRSTTGPTAGASGRAAGRPGVARRRPATRSTPPPRTA